MPLKKNGIKIQSWKRWWKVQGIVSDCEILAENSADGEEIINQKMLLTADKQLKFWICAKEVSEELSKTGFLYSS